MIYEFGPDAIVFFHGAEGEETSAHYRIAPRRIPPQVSARAETLRRFRAIDVIRKKRDGGELTRAEIEALVGGYTRGEIPDYQFRVADGESYCAA